MAYHIETNLDSDGINFPSITIFFWGCDKKIKCKNCHNQQLWEFNKESNNTKRMLEEIKIQINKVEKVYDKIAVCFCGGEPLASHHIFDMAIVSKIIKREFRDKIATIVYSWRTMEQIENQKKMDYMQDIDYGILGAFDETKYVDDFPASTNQKIINFKTMKEITKEEVI